MDVRFDYIDGNLRTLFATTTEFVKFDESDATILP